jgi:hypothetical protein
MLTRLLDMGGCVARSPRSLIEICCVLKERGEHDKQDYIKNHIWLGFQSGLLLLLSGTGSAGLDCADEQVGMGVRCF